MQYLYLIEIKPDLQAMLFGLIFTQIQHPVFGRTASTPKGCFVERILIQYSTGKMILPSGVDVFIISKHQHLLINNQWAIVCYKQTKSPAIFLAGPNYIANN
jgi:hypothetical protein